MKEEPSATNLIFSYVPLLVGPPGQAYMGEGAIGAAADVAESLEDLPSGSAKACVWMAGEDGASAIFAMDQARDIAEHLRHWAEGKPEDWFAFHFLEKCEAYAIALMPNFRKSSERWKIAFQLRHGYPPIMGQESLIFRPLHCVAPTKNAFVQAKKFMKSTVRIGLVESSEVSPESYRVPEDRIQWLGNFKAVSETEKTGIAHGWLESQIDEMFKPEGAESRPGGRG